MALKDISWYLPVSTYDIAVNFAATGFHASSRSVVRALPFAQLFHGCRVRTGFKRGRARDPGLNPGPVSSSRSFVSCWRRCAAIILALAAVVLSTLTTAASLAGCVVRLDRVRARRCM